MKSNATIAEVLFVLAAWMAAVGAPRIVAAQPATTRCAACHFANMSEVPSPERLADWQRSAHARHVVGCHECHGGDPWAVVPRDAHRGVVAAGQLSSPVNAANVVWTCGRCHEANARAFERSTHRASAARGGEAAPTCTTCHDTMRAAVPSPSALEARCAACHPADSARGEYPALMHEGVEALNALRVRIDALDDAVARVPEHGRRVELLVALNNARGIVAASIAAIHTFDIQQVNERLTIARREIDALAAATSTAVSDR